MKNRHAIGKSNGIAIPYMKVTKMTLSIAAYLKCRVYSGPLYRLTNYWIVLALLFYFLQLHLRSSNLKKTLIPKNPKYSMMGMKEAVIIVIIREAPMSLYHSYVRSV